MGWKGLTGAAALAVLVSGMTARAGELSAGAPDDSQAPLLFDDTTAPSTAPTSAPAASSPPLTPIMYMLDPTSFGKWLENNHINITGFAEGGFWYDTNNPRAEGSPGGDAPTYVTFPGAYSDHILLDQVDLTIQKSLDTSKQWDWGVLFENGYGSDDAFTHSFGILDNRAPASFNTPPEHPQDQYDIIQANVSVLVPLGSGLTITAGKFVALLGEELIDPVTNPFYTHSYSFFYGIPATNTGITGSYTFSKLINGNDWTLIGGVTRGWNMSSKDNNGSPDMLFEAKGGLTDKLALTLNLEEGPEATGDVSDYWTTVEAIAAYTVSDQLTLTGDFLYSAFPHGAVTTAGESAQWYGAAGYAAYKINNYFTVNFRGEWYRDQGGFTTGFQANYYEGTLGLQIHPFPNDNILQFLQVRPEVREDWSDRPVYDLAHNGGAGDYNQLSAGLDVIMQF